MSDQLAEIKEDLKSKYDFYLGVMKSSRVDGYYQKHDCGSTSHKACLKNWAHSSILLELVCQFYWCFFDYQPVYCNLKNRPKLKDVMYRVFSNREDLDSKEYSWLMAVKDDLKELVPNYYGAKKP